MSFEFNNKDQEIKQNSFDVDKRIDGNEIFEKVQDSFNVDKRIESNLQKEIGRCIDKIQNFDGTKEELINTLYELKNNLSSQLEIKNVPNLIFLKGLESYCYGFYDAKKNKICLNVEKTSEPVVLGAVLAHELRHVWQHERMNLPENEKNDYDKMLSENDKNYIRPEDNYFAYQVQLIELDADRYAQNLFGEDVWM